MQGVVGVGTVPDEVLLACGSAESVPTTWWTPSLVDRPRQDVARLRAAAESSLVTTGDRDAASGRLTGVLGAVADVVASASVLLLLETESGNSGPQRRSVVVAPERSLLDLHGEGLHDLLLATPAATCMLLADLLAGADLRVPTPAVRAVAGVRTVEEVEAALPSTGRTATTRIWRTAVDPDTDGAIAHIVTVVHHPMGVVACWALPAGQVMVHLLDDLEAVGDLALALLGAVSDEEAS